MKKVGVDMGANFALIAFISGEDRRALMEAEKSYGDSWCKRGGVGAFMMLARKWDRIEQQCKEHGYDIFEAMRLTDPNTGLADDVRDLRRYLLLVEQYMRGDIPENTDLDLSVEDPAIECCGRDNCKCNEGEVGREDKKFDNPLEPRSENMDPTFEEITAKGSPPDKPMGTSWEEIASSVTVSPYEDESLFESKESHVGLKGSFDGGQPNTRDYEPETQTPDGEEPGL